MKNYKKLKLITLFTILLSFVNISSASSNIPFESTYVPMAQTNTLFRGANIYDGEGNEFLDTDLLIKDGKIIALGKDLPASSEFTVVDAAGKWITPGIIDIHSHMGCIQLLE